jgi:molybdenum cofactor cytidylyltransferase
MFFGEIRTGEAEGAILAHSLKLASATFRKGRVLSASDIALLLQENIETVTAARLDETDIGEDEAAALIAEPFLSPGMTRSEAFTGRVNLFAADDGLFQVNRSAINALNSLDEAMTIATLAPDSIVRRGQMVATIKIIPFSAPSDRVAAWCALAKQGEPAVSIAAFRTFNAGLVLSGTDALKPSIVRKTIDATRERLELAGGTLLDPVMVNHDSSSVGQAIRSLGQQGAELILASGVSAIVDRRDVIPAAIEDIGGEVLHFGMPVDPGNLILLGRHESRYVIGLPGCARSPKMNGFDWILNRCATGQEITSADIMEMGVGGLLKEGARPMPREQEELGPRPGRQRIGAVVLAAGQSRRMGKENKLLKSYEGEPLVRHTVTRVKQADIASLVVVTGHQREEVEEVLSPLDVKTVYCPDHADGLSASLRTGLANLPDDLDGVVVCLADMPLLTPRHLNRLIASFDPVEGREICVPTRNGKRGNPVLWSSRFIAEMTAIRGDTGARHLIGENEDVLVEVAMEDDGVLVDLDSPEAWEAIGSR